jgi:hypothetical protein
MPKETQTREERGKFVPNMHNNSSKPTRAASFHEELKQPVSDLFVILLFT